LLAVALLKTTPGVCVSPRVSWTRRAARRCLQERILCATALQIAAQGNQEGLQPVPQVQGCCPLTRPAASRLQAFLISLMRMRIDTINRSRNENVDRVDPLTT